MRIAHLITRMIVGGAQENTLLNCLDLAGEYGDEVLLVTGPSLGPEGDLLAQAKVREGRAGEGRRADTVAGFPIERLRFDHLGRDVELPVVTVPSLVRAIRPATDWRALGDLRAILRAYRPEVVHTHSAKAGILGRVAAWSLHVPAIVHTVHGAPFGPYDPWPRRKFYAWCERYAARRCHKLVSVADAMTDLMVAARVAPREKFTTIYSGMEVEPFLAAPAERDAVREQLGYHPADIVIGKIARLFHLKGHEYVVRAARAVVDAIPCAKFLFVGDGILQDRLRAQIRAAGLQDHFQFTGLVPPERIPGLIAAMDIVVHTSLREGLARVLPQALIVGRPVVTYDIDGAREVAIPGQTGYLLPPESVTELSQALIDLARDPSQRAQYGATGRQRFANQFRHETMTARTREVYERVLAKR